MSVIEIASIVSALSATVSCFISMSNSYKLTIVHRETNSMKDQLVQATQISAEAIGEARGRQMEKEKK